MEITVNNRKETFETDKLTLQELIEKKGYTFKMLVTKINGKLIKKEARKDCYVNDGDNVTVLHLVSGG
mgnify:CR=1 FL=1